MCILCGRPGLDHNGDEPSQAPGGTSESDPAALVVSAPAATVVETTDAAANTGTAYTLAIGQTAQGVLSSNSDHDWYRVTLTAGQTYTFAMTGTGLNNVHDSYLRLYASDGTTIVAQNDDSLPNHNSIFTYTPSVSGTFYIDAGSYNDSGSGQYGVSVTAGNKASFDALMGAG